MMRGAEHGYEHRVAMLSNEETYPAEARHGRLRLGQISALAQAAAAWLCFRGRSHEERRG